MSARSISKAALAGVFFAVLSGARAADAPLPSIAEQIGREVRGVFEQCRRAVVKIEGYDAHGSLSGTGFFIDATGTLYTSYTIGGETQGLVVEHEGVKYPAPRLIADPRGGVAILKIDAETPFLLPGKARELALASPVVAIGYPMDLPLY